MATRFRKSINLGGGVKLNLNKKSVGVSAGVKGARVSVNSDGRKTATAGIPGTGLYCTKSVTNSNETHSTDPSGAVTHSGDSRFFAFILTFLGVLLIILSALISIAVLPAGLIGIVLGILLTRYGCVIRKRMRNATSDCSINSDTDVQ